MKLLRTIFLGSIVSVCCIISPLAGFSALPAVVGFTDATQTSGLRFQHRNSTTANKYLIEAMAGGVAVFDYDNDGDPDLMLANGHPNDFIDRYKSNVTYREPLLLFENSGGQFKDVSKQAGSVFAKQFPARGLATGDYDNDGDLDALVVNNGAAPLLLKNNGGNKNNWLGLQLVATKSNPGAVGALLTWTAGGLKRSRLKTAGGSYLASHDPREILGLGPAAKVESLEIKWPSGQVDKLANVPAGRYLKLVEGKGVVEAAKQPGVKR